jgi:hypothetical protein
MTNFKRGDIILVRELIVKRIGSMPEPVLRQILAQIRQLF